MAQPARRQRRLIFDTIILGIGGALAAQVFMWLLRLANHLFLLDIAGYVPPTLRGEGGTLQQTIGPHGLWLVPLSTTLGGLIVGLMSWRLAPEIEGHGTDTAVRAFHRANGLLRARVAPIKALASAITIGSGGAAGREGPIALVAAGIGSWYAGINKCSDQDRRLFLLIGMAAGLAAVFRSPVGTAIFAIEVLYGGMEFESDALLYALLASIVAYALNGFFVSWKPLFEVPATLGLGSPYANGWFIVLGIAAGLMAPVLPNVFYGIRDAFHKLPVPPYLKPALGGLAVGLLGLAVPQVLGGGYGWIQLAIDGRLTLDLLILLSLAKILALSLSVSSGGSGGVFAPSLFVGAMLGGFWAALLHQPPAPFVVVGMAAVFAGAARVPIATLLMVTEMTGGYQLLVPAALAVLLSYLVSTTLTRRLQYKSLYEAQVRNRWDSPAHHTEHLNIALRILRERRQLDPSAVGNLDLLSLLRSGVPVELPENRRLVIAVLRPDSAYANTKLGPEGGRLEEGGAQIVTIIRGEHMLAARPGLELKGGDRMLLLTTADALERLKPNLDKW
jgi:CIC family chloride channel protein